MNDLEGLQPPVQPEEHPAETKTEKAEYRNELKRNLAWFVENDDIEGLANFVERIAHVDPLTNVLNRRGFLSEAQPRLERIANLTDGLDRRTGEYLTFNVLFLDLDHFKAVNDTYGHAAGDAALQSVTAVVKESLRVDDIIGRYGGEEFVVAFMCYSKKSLIHRDRYVVAEKIRETIEQNEFTYDDNKIPLTASIGVAQLIPADEDLEQLIKRADKAMYRAKKGGRNRVVVAEEES